MSELRESCWQCSKDFADTDDWCSYCGAYLGGKEEAAEDLKIDTDKESILYKIDLFLHRRTRLHRFKIVQRYCDWACDRLFVLWQHKGKPSGL